jgi:hypothetical protein
VTNQNYWLVTRPVALGWSVRFVGETVVQDRLVSTPTVL